MSIEVSPRVQTLLNRLTSTRAGYLDELDFDLDARLGSPAHVSVVGDIADLITRVKGLNDIHDDLGTVDGNVSAILTDIVDMEGTGFVKDTHSLVNI